MIPYVVCDLYPITINPIVPQVQDAQNEKKNKKIRGLLELSESHPVFGPAFNPYPLFQWYPQSKNSKGLRLIIVIVEQVAAVKIYVTAAAEALTKKETTK
jgi:hypothetical protein